MHYRLPGGRRNIQIDQIERADITGAGQSVAVEIDNAAGHQQLVELPQQGFTSLPINRATAARQQTSVGQKVCAVSMPPNATSFEDSRRNDQNICELPIVGIVFALTTKTVSK